MATHSCILAWRIPWTEESEGLESMGLSKSQTQLSDSTTITTTNAKGDLAANVLKIGIFHRKVQIPSEKGRFSSTSHLQELAEAGPFLSTRLLLVAIPAHPACPSSGLTAEGVLAPYRRETS